MRRRFTFTAKLLNPEFSPVSALDCSGSAAKDEQLLSIAPSEAGRTGAVLATASPALIQGPSHKDGVASFTYVCQECGPGGIALPGDGRGTRIVRTTHVPPVRRDAPDQPQPSLCLQQRWPTTGTRHVKSFVLILFRGTALAERIRSRGLSWASRSKGYRCRILGDHPEMLQSAHSKAMILGLFLN